MRPLILQLFNIMAIRFGQFTLKSGVISPIYLDLRPTISYPKLLVLIAQELYMRVRTCPYERLCGVPYTALPFATVISIQHEIPMIMRRKEKKEYGTAKQIEGLFHEGERCMIIEDVITSGSSILETARDLRAAGLRVEDAAVLIDREQGAISALTQEGIRVHPVLTLSNILSTLTREGKISTETERNVHQFLAKHQL
jgi:orotate phosphoribosyltransferase